jgi:hypothetical protein
MVTDQQVVALGQRAQEDEFAARLYDDPLGALRSDGYEEFAGDVERQLAQIDVLVGQLLDDGEFRGRVEEDPTGTLIDWGLPGPAIVPVLGILGAPEDVIGRASDDIELHGKRTQITAAAAAAVLGALAFAQSASAASPEVIRWGGIDAQAQVTPNPFRSGDPGQAQPNPRFYGGPGQAQPNPRYYGGPTAVRYYGLQSFFRSR